MILFLPFTYPELGYVAERIRDITRKLGLGPAEVLAKERDHACVHRGR